jgi:hypothetical protein
VIAHDVLGPERLHDLQVLVRHRTTIRILGTKCCSFRRYMAAADTEDHPASTRQDIQRCHDLCLHERVPVWDNRDMSTEPQFG